MSEHAAVVKSGPTRGRRRRRAVVASLASAALVVGGVLVVGSPAVAAPTTPLTVTIMSVDGVGDDLDGIGRSDADFYAGVEFGTGTVSAYRTADPSFATHVDDDANVTPFWPIAGLVDVYTVDDVPTAMVTLSIWDHDDCSTAFCTDTGVFESDDDQLDIKSGAGETVQLAIDMSSGRWSGDAAWPANCVTGDGGEAVKVCFDVSIDSPTGDSDGDGLLDGWERNGFDADSNGTIDVDLPAFGATVAHRDLFLELDYSTGQTPRRDDIQAMRDAFADAPLGNPDGVNGVRLHVDTGPLVDTTAIKNQPLGTCSDGIDNGGDGRIDAADQDCDNTGGGTSGEYLETSTEDPGPANCTPADVGDPSCLVGDNLGGGNLLPQHLNNCGVDAVFYNAKNGGGAFPTANFSPSRNWIFRYAISTQPDQDTDGPGPDTACNSGGQGELGGNDFTDFNHDGGTIMHELGHTLGLRHGGNENGNCKPNYVSVMDYDEQFGISRVGGGVVIDYSPPRVRLDATTRGSAPLAQLAENALDENIVLDAADTANLIVFKDGAGVRRTGPLTGGVDWSGDTTISPAGTIENPVNINGSSPPGPIPAPPAPAPQRPGACASNTANTDTMNGFNDWNQISIPFRQFGDAGDGAVNPADDEMLPTIAARDEMNDQLNTVDVGVSLSDSPDPVGAGEQFTVTATAANAGPNPANSVEVTVNVPTGLTVVSTSASCVTSTATVRCNLGSVAAGASRQFDVVFGVPADFLYPDASREVTTSASVDNLAGPDPTAGNDTASTTTTVITKADVSVTATRASGPLEILVGQTGQVSVVADVANAGPTSPVDARVTTTASGGSGLSLTPSSRNSDVTALAIGTPQTAQATFTATCTAPGLRTISVATSVALTASGAVDPVPTNNTGSAGLTVDCVVPIAINVRPGSSPNPINLNTDATLAALTTTAGEYGLPIAFDATKIDPLSARWGLRTALFNTATVTGASESHAKLHTERSYEPDERTRDRDLDAILHFKPSDSGLTATTTEGCLKVSFRAPNGEVYRAFGCDSVRIVPKR